MKKFRDFVNEEINEPVFSLERAKKWLERIKQDPEIQKFIGIDSITKSTYKEFENSIKNISLKYKNDLYPKEMEYIREMLYDVIFLNLDDENESVKS